MEPLSVVPQLGLGAFTCPFCGAFAQQRWEIPVTASSKRVIPGRSPNGVAEDHELKISICVNCSRRAIWLESRMVFPATLLAEQPHPDLPENVLVDYEEARQVVSYSSRSAAALLRLCVQKLCETLGESGENINRDVASLVKKGLPVRIQQSLDILRVVGNEQVHPGTLDVRDDPLLAGELFRLVNFIVENQIAEPKAIQALYERLPEAKRLAIEDRDRAQSTSNA